MDKELDYPEFIKQNKIDTEIVLRVLYYALKCYKNGLTKFKTTDVTAIYLKMHNEEEMTEEKCTVYLEYLYYNGFFGKQLKEIDNVDKFLNYSFENSRSGYLK
ncbi:MAG: hypothetical protein K8R54_17380 [Bacteroidales bacterium]|nr:hypothetical protein [Bacteroidales bacterium]